ncbi:MAG: GNAT family N-acetyltransferase [Pseudomonadota bacterium]
MSAVLRAARPEDAMACGVILTAFAEETPWLPRLHSGAEDIAHCGQMIDRGWVTVAGARPKGFLARDGAIIHALYVAPSARGQGLGTALLAQAQEANRLELWTFQANTGAQRFYTRHGFQEAERTDGHGNDEGLPDIRYIWERSV